MGAWSHKIDGNDTYCDVVYDLENKIESGETVTVDDFHEAADSIISSWGDDYEGEVYMALSYFAVLNALPIDENIREKGLICLDDEASSERLEDWTKPDERKAYVEHFHKILVDYSEEGEKVDDIEPSAGILETILVIK